MKKLILLLFSLSVSLLFAKPPKVYKYHLYVTNYNNPPLFIKISEQLVYAGNNSNLGSF